MNTESVLKKIQEKLLTNDRLLDEIDKRREEFHHKCQEEQMKIETYCQAVKDRLNDAIKSFKAKASEEFRKQENDILVLRERVRTNSLVLCPEFEKFMSSGSFDKTALEEIWTKTKDALATEFSLPLTSECSLSFHGSNTFIKIKSSDIGFINIAEYMPEQYHLSLTAPNSNIIGLDQKSPVKIACEIIADHVFTEKVQANIKFVMKSKHGNRSLPFVREECCLSEDKTTFKMAFVVDEIGSYLVTVLLYGQHVTNSPLNIIVRDKLCDGGSLKAHSKPNEDDFKENLNGGKLEKVIQEENRSSLSMLKSSCDKIGLMEDFSSEKKMHKKTTEDAAIKDEYNKDMNTCDSDVKAEKNYPSYHCPPVELKLPQNPSVTSVSSNVMQHQNSTSSNLSNEDGFLDLSPIKDGRRLSGDRMLCINDGAADQNLCRPIGMCLLKNGSMAVASTFENKVKLFSCEGKFLLSVKSSGQPFDRPSDMVTLASGHFAVRDSSRIQLFTENGTFVRTLGYDRKHEKCYGLAENDDGDLITVMESRKSTNLCFFDLQSGNMVKRIELDAVIKNRADSKCRFLAYKLAKFYIADLGLDCVYVLDSVTSKTQVLGSSGSQPGQLSDPAGLGIDSAGNVIVADSKNHRICLFAKNGEFKCNLKLDPDIKRPSGVVVDNVKHELYVLLLQGRVALAKYKLK